VVYKVTWGSLYDPEADLNGCLKKSSIRVRPRDNLLAAPTVATGTLFLLPHLACLASIPSSPSLVVTQSTPFPLGQVPPPNPTDENNWITQTLFADATNVCRLENPVGPCRTSCAAPHKSVPCICWEGLLLTIGLTKPSVRMFPCLISS
jgi:hypothetical protein